MKRICLGGRFKVVASLVAWTKQSMAEPGFFWVMKQVFWKTWAQWRHADLGLFCTCLVSSLLSVSHVYNGAELLVSTSAFFMGTFAWTRHYNKCFFIWLFCRPFVVSGMTVIWLRDEKMWNDIHKARRTLKKLKKRDRVKNKNKKERG